MTSRLGTGKSLTFFTVHIPEDIHNLVVSQIHISHKLGCPGSLTTFKTLLDSAQSYQAECRFGNLQAFICNCVRCCYFVRCSNFLSWDLQKGAVLCSHSHTPLGAVIFFKTLMPKLSIKNKNIIHTTVYM